MKWIIILFIVTILGLGFYYCPALTLQILNTMFKVFTLCISGIITMTGKVIKSCGNKIKDWKKNMTLKKKQNLNNDTNNHVDSNIKQNPNIVINIENLNDSSIFNNK